MSISFPSSRSILGVYEGSHAQMSCFFLLETEFLIYNPCIDLSQLYSSSTDTPPVNIGPYCDKHKSSLDATSDEGTPREGQCVL